jgi:hypothetical protein
VDLDLDLIAYQDGTYRVDDEDEFLPTSASMRTRWRSSNVPAPNSPR